MRNKKKENVKVKNRKEVEMNFKINRIGKIA
jgi:hypothetical protein